MVIKVNKGNYTNKLDVFNVIRYVINPERDDLITSGLVGIPISASIEEIQNAFCKNKLYYRKTTGRNIRHIIISLSDEDMKYVDANALCNLGYYIANNIYVGYYMVFGIHQPMVGHLHMHLVVDTVNYFTGLKLQESPWQLKQHKEMIKKFLNSFLPDGLCYQENLRNFKLNEEEYNLQKSNNIQSLL